MRQVASGDHLVTGPVRATDKAKSVQKSIAIILILTSSSLAVLAVLFVSSNAGNVTPVVAALVPELAWVIDPLDDGGSDQGGTVNL